MIITFESLLKLLETTVNGSNWYTAEKIATLIAEECKKRIPNDSNISIPDKVDDKL